MSVGGAAVPADGVYAGRVHVQGSRVRGEVEQVDLVGVGRHGALDDGARVRVSHAEQVLKPGGRRPAVVVGEDDQRCGGRATGSLHTPSAGC